MTPLYDVIVDKIENILLVTGIATPAPLLSYLELNYNVLHIKYSDHYSFTVDDINHIHQKFDNFASNNKIILTTEKDFVRFKDNKLDNYINLNPWYKISISLKFDDEDGLIQLLEKIMLEKIKETAAFIQSKTTVKPSVGIILGTGLGGLVKEINIIDSIPYEEICNFPVSTVKGHSGRLILGELEANKLLLCKVVFIFMKDIQCNKLHFQLE